MNLRWIEYAVSASLMTVLVARFAGIADLAACMGVFAFATSMGFFGLLMDRQQRSGSADSSAFWFGSLTGAVPWPQCRWRDYRFGEVVYMLLSLGAKSVPAWLVFANVLRS